MFGFGDSKKKKYKKALEEFLQKMMSVKDYFEIIQSRGKGHAQMAEMLGVKVSDTDYWAKEHFEEYKTRFSQSNDPLSDIELRLKNYSFIKKEMEGFINYAKELEMNLTQGFVDDYYATVSTFKSLSMCNDFFVFKVSKPVKSKYNDVINKVLDLPKNIVVVEDDKLILWVYKPVVNENTGDVIDSLDVDEIKRNVNLFENKFFKVKSDPFTIVGYFETKNQAISFYNSLALRKFPNHLLEGPFFNYDSYSSPIQSETYRKEVRVSIQACSVGLTARKSTSFMIELTFDLILDDLKNEMSNEKLENNSENNLFDTDELEDDILRGVEMSFHWFKKENPQIEKESSDKTLDLWIKFIKYCYCNEPETYELNEIFPFKPTELMIKAHEQTITWFREYYVDHENVASRLVEDEDPAEVVVDKLEKISSEINTGDFFNLLNFPDRESTKEDESVNIKGKEFESYDLRKLIVELSENDNEILLSVDERIFAEFQLENNTGQENFDKGDDSELKNIDEYDPNKYTYTGKTLSREDESKVDKENLLKYLNEYIESADFDEEESDLDSFCSWAVFEYGMSFEQDLILSYQEEVFYVEGENTMKVSCYFMEEQRSYDLKITIVR